MVDHRGAFDPEAPDDWSLTVQDLAIPEEAREPVTVDIPDPAKWSLAYGTEGVQEIRKDVKAYVGNLVQQSEMADEVGATVTWK
ncbi:Hypothetical protein AJAP_27990 [Amycolatopsis japonica]|uniref:Uncharacterized protein n=1 Tax=Amycolatopsis japonica TaxID=208439 RepID=A0A075UW89_9PSEU|nr:hypothetical protein [Amycolatopsis japonica]AIG78437.1 Hypothetical protein AJAP_27990 [Amycolatopsis japonica]